MRAELTQEQVRSRYHYDPETGALIALASSSKRKKGEAIGCKYKTEDGKTYWYTMCRGLNISVHRIIWLWMTGILPRKIDHQDGNGLNNRWDNLAAATDSSNNLNRRRQSNNKSGHCGVYWNKGKWQVQIYFQRRSIYLGRFDCLNEAAAARREAQERLGFHPNHGTDRPL